MKLKLQTADKKIIHTTLYDLLVYTNSKWFEKRRWINTITIFNR